MVAEERYREISFTRLVGSREDGIEADTTLVFRDGQAYRRIRSKTRPGFYTDVRADGDPVEYERRILHEKRVMSDFDEAGRLRAVPKPAPDVQETVCPDCNGVGEAPDKHGNWKTCRRCGG